MQRKKLFWLFHFHSSQHRINLEIWAPPPKIRCTPPPKKIGLLFLLFHNSLIPFSRYFQLVTLPPPLLKTRTSKSNSAGYRVFCTMEGGSWVGPFSKETNSTHDTSTDTERKKSVCSVLQGVYKKSSLKAFSYFGFYVGHPVSQQKVATDSSSLASLYFFFPFFCVSKARWVTFLIPSTHTRAVTVGSIILEKNTLPSGIALPTIFKKK